jgi:tRNA wybutosine-synthesizing protein 3
VGFEIKKIQILESYRHALVAGLVDEDVRELNDCINSHKDWVTTSSCFGRIIVISKSSTRSKYKTQFHLKTHSPRVLPTWRLDNIKFKGELWLLMEAPNLHVRCKDANSAKRLIKMALQAKLGKSKYQSIDPSLIVEILGTASLQIPLGEDDTITCDTSTFNLAKRKASELLQQEQDRLSQFHSLICK